MSVHTERIFGPETPTGRYKHPAAITELSNGDLYLAYYGGGGEYDVDTAVYGSRRKKGETRWSPPRVIARDPFRSAGNPVVWTAPDSTVWLFYVVRFGATWSTSRIMAKISRDHAETFSDASVLVLEAGMMVRSQPVVLANGDYLLPVYCETGNDTEIVPADTTSLFLRYDIQRKIWSETNRVRSRLGNLQPALARIDDNHLIAYCRRGGDYRGRPDGWLVRTESRDGGRTWSDGADTKFPNPNAAVAFLRLASGNLLLVYNDSFSRRTPLTAALSTDNDRTYPHRRNLAEGANSFGYPYAIQTSDGMIHVIYTSDNRGVINHAVFDETTLLSAG